MRGLGIIALLICSAPLFPATVFTFSGTFNTDDQLQIIFYTVQNTGQVTVETTSFATGGFSPILTLFDSIGAFQFDSQGYPTNSDASLSWNSIAGQQYSIVLSQWDNLSPGPGANFSDGFSEQGNGNFTAAPPFNNPTPGASFLLPGGEQRTGSWALTITSDDPTLEATVSIPEPIPAVMWLSGVALLGAWKVRRSRV